MSGSQRYNEPGNGVVLPPPEIPKQRIPWFTWMLVAFAGLVLTGIVISFIAVADEPRPLLDTPAGELAPGPIPQERGPTSPAPAAP